jgi:hypothetical protein
MSAKQVTLSSDSLPRSKPSAALPGPLGPSLGTGEPLWLEGTEDAMQEKGILQDWLRWVTQGPASTVYLHPALVLAAARESAAPLVYVRRTGTQAWTEQPACLAALAPKTRHVHVVPGLPLRLSLHGRCLIGNQLLGDEGEISADVFARDLAQWLCSAGSDCDFVFFEDIEDQSPLWQALAKEAARGEAVVLYPDKPQPHWWIRFPEKPEEYWKQFSAKTRYNLRREAQKLDHSVTCFAEKESVPVFLEKAHEVSKRSWQTKRLGVRIRNTLEERSFFEFLASQGALRSYVLEQNGRPLAFEVGVQWRGCFVLEEAGYDSSYSSHSPGTVLLFRILQDLIARDTPRLVDFGFGDGEYKRIFGNWQTASGPVLLMRGSFRPLLAMWIDRLGRKASRAFRAASKRLRILPALRRVYRR